MFCSTVITGIFSLGDHLSPSIFSDAGNKTLHTGPSYKEYTLGCYDQANEA